MLKRNKKIILVGYKSFIQENLYNYLKQNNNIEKIKFKDLNKLKLENCQLIINFSQDQNFYSKKYLKKKDRNLYISNLIKKKKIKLILLSTRQVYLPKLNITEKSKLKPMNIYAKNCLKSESLCRLILKNKLLVLRLSNVIGLEIGKKKKPSLMSLFISGLKKKLIIVDNNYYLYKDLIPIELLCEYMKKLIEKDIYGVVNVGSGIPILVKSFIEHIFDLKYVKFKVIKSNLFNDQNYSFNIKKLQNITNIRVKKNKLAKYFDNLKIKVKKYND